MSKKVPRVRPSIPGYLVGAGPIPNGFGYTVAEMIDEILGQTVTNEVDLSTLTEKLNELDPSCIRPLYGRFMNKGDLLQGTELDENAITTKRRRNQNFIYRSLKGLPKKPKSNQPKG
jgi:hypothetical protein